MSRADFIRQTKKEPEFFSDFTIDLDKNPITGQLARKTNAEAIKESVKNLILTSPRERFYQPYIGSDVQNSLFGLVDDPLTLDEIKNSISRCIEQNEPRASVSNIDIKEIIGGNGYEVTIFLEINNSSEIIPLTISINRIR